MHKMGLRKATEAHTKQNKYLYDLRASDKEKLNHLKKFTQIESGSIKAYTDETQSEIERNKDTIESLRNTIHDLRTARAESDAKSEYLMRQALTDHHPGSKIFHEKEPRDVNDALDNKVCDVQNKLNKIRHLRLRKNKHLQKLQGNFVEAVGDVVYLELEGPAGDTRCLSLENHLSERGKKSSEAEVLNHIYRRICDQLAVENMANGNAMDAAEMLVEHHEKELRKCRAACAEAVTKKTQANAGTYRMEYDLHGQRRERHQSENEIRKTKEEQTHELNALWHKIQACFAMQDSMPMGQAISGHAHFGNVGEADLSPIEVLEQLEGEFSVLKGVTGCKKYEEVVEQFSNQRETYQHLTSLASELEVKKLTYLGKLEGISNVKASHRFKTDSAGGIQLQTASGDCASVKSSWEHHQWSLMAAQNGVTQTLLRLRQTLQHLVDVFISSGLIRPLPKHEESNTEVHLLSSLAAANSGVSALMADVGDRDEEQARRQAAAAGFIMSKSEKRMHTVRAQIDRPEKEEALGVVFDDSDTTVDDSRVPTRAAIKRQSHLLCIAKTKHGARKSNSVRGSKDFP